MRLGIVSGYFNPVHIGHLEYIHAAKLQCDFLLCIVNNDLQVKLKGSKPFMDEEHRKSIMAHFRDVDRAEVAIDTDKTVCASLQRIAKNEWDAFPDHKITFFNSGDRTGNNAESAEVILCRRLGIKYVEIPLPKRYSSSKLLEHLKFS